ncbi:MAG: S-methyl-5-thioribose-1-phosphate isomerase [Gemmatimonadaceae bacterium]|nr:S-methyl-5-thioribose-1-phosphate isomerase [Gemmatimonadaceae bacterium]
MGETLNKLSHRSSLYPTLITPLCTLPVHPTVPVPLHLASIPRALTWSSPSRTLRILDQRFLPGQEVERELRTLDEVEEAIRTLAVRGAPAIGVAAALGLVAALARGRAPAREALFAAMDRLASARPTAVNLPWAMRRLRTVVEASADEGAALLDALASEAEGILAEDVEMCAKIGQHGAALIPDGARVLTHCNAGALATAGIGTALAPVYTAVMAGRRVEVIACETRPLLQGSRITAWELARAGVPVTVCTDGMAASLMRDGRVDLVIVGADRIAANGDVANKIGTYAHAIAARHHQLPFYIAAPSSTVDPTTSDGRHIPIEARAADEVRRCGGAVVMPDVVGVHNPAFDVTPAELVTAFITDHGVVRPPFHFSS